jgi:nicotinamide-nucleotide amidase
MGEQVFGEEDEQLEHVVVRMLNERRLTFATAEIGTGGLLTRRITEVAGQENCFRGGIVAPSDEALAASIALREPLLQTETSRERGSEESTKIDEHARIAALANGCRERFRVDFLLFVGPFPKYDPEDATSVAPTSQVALAGDKVSRVVDYTFLGDLTLNKSRAAKIALNLLRLHLMRLDKPAEPQD